MRGGYQACPRSRELAFRPIRVGIRQPDADQKVQDRISQEFKLFVIANRADGFAHEGRVG